MLTIEKPKLSESQFKSAISEIRKNRAFFDEIHKSQNPIYKSWEKVKFNPTFDPKLLWAGIKILRHANAMPLLVKSESETYFKFWELPRYRRFFSKFDAIAVGKDFHIDVPHQKIFIQNGILEEAIQSSKIEGAVTTRKEAKKMIRENRTPKNKSEQMILNNYETIQKIQTEWKNQNLSLELLFEIHFSITQKTDLERSEMYRLRKNSDKINVVENMTGKIAHFCPDEKFVEKEVKKLIAFANDELDDDNYQFFHPLTKAIVLHFWIGYLHPFVDGNGRTARALFYWYLLKKGYWAIPFIPISNKIYKAQRQYRDAFLQTEQDDFDFNYFFDFNIQKLELSIDDFYAELAKLKSQKDEETQLLQKNFNARQIALLRYFWHNPKTTTTIKIHENFHKIHNLTSRFDLLDLEKQNYLSRKKIGKTLHFFPNEEKINELFNA